MVFPYGFADLADEAEGGGLCQGTSWDWACQVPEPLPASGCESCTPLQQERRFLCKKHWKLKAENRLSSPRPSWQWMWRAKSLWHWWGHASLSRQQSSGRTLILRLIEMGPFSWDWFCWKVTFLLSCLTSSSAAAAVEEKFLRNWLFDPVIQLCPQAGRQIHSAVISWGRKGQSCQRQRQKACNEGKEQ